MIALLVGLATAGPLDGWQDSRWLVEIEETLPLQLAIAGPDASPVLIRAVQISAIATCPEFKMAGKKAAYAVCSLEQLGLRASPAADPGDRLQDYKTALSGLEAAMKAGTFELKLKDTGKVGSVDFHEPPKTDPMAVEAARAIATDLFAGFSLEREDVPAGSVWEERGSLLLRGPSRPMGQGQCKIRHVPIEHEGKKLLQSTAGLPPGPGQPAPGCTYTSAYFSWGSGQVQKMGATTAAAGEYGTMSGTALNAQERLFDAELDSIAFEAREGPFAERIWNVRSMPQADMTGQTGTPLWSAGHIKRLDAGAEAEVGATGLVGAPGANFADLPPWKPMPTLGS